METNNPKMTNQKNIEQQLVMAFYGDDFTGSTDALEFLCRAGASTMLFIETPTVAQLQLYPQLQAFGIAGKTRSMTPVEMEETLVPAFEELKKMNLRHIQYKVCSTFDSSPTIGSIGKVMDLAAKVFANTFIPLLVAAPSLGRYCLFGNLFAQMGIGSKGEVYRLDQHPSMKNHPVTPADESDLRLHLSKQTKQLVGLINILDLEKTDDALNEILENNINQNNTIVLIDALYQEQLLKIGHLLDQQVPSNGNLFSVGSSAIDMALGAYFGKEKKWEPIKEWPDPGIVNPLLVLSGSCSPVTSAQINWAKANDFEELILDADEINATGWMANSVQQALVKAQLFLAANKSVVIHTNAFAYQNKQDTEQKTNFTNQSSEPINQVSRNIDAKKIGTVLGLLAKKLHEITPIKRVVLAGGDSSSYAARAMEIDAVEMIAPLVAGAPLCKVHAKNKGVDGLEINFKGGQVGAEDYFGILKQGKTH